MTQESHAYTSFHWTHVQFQPGDRVGYILAFTSLFPIFLLVSYVTLILGRREIILVTTLIGQLLNECINYVVKKSVQEQRPTLHLGRGYGMPSSHAQFMAFWAVYCLLYLYKKIHIQGRAWKHLIATIVSTTALAVCYSRVYLMYHTPKQVFVGAGAGVLLGYGWYQLTERVLRTRVFPLILKTDIAEYSMLRDSGVVRGSIWQREWEMCAMYAIHTRQEHDVATTTKSTKTSKATKKQK